MKLVCIFSIITKKVFDLLLEPAVEYADVSTVEGVLDVVYCSVNDVDSLVDVNVVYCSVNDVKSLVEKNVLAWTVVAAVVLVVGSSFCGSI